MSFHSPNKLYKTLSIVLCCTFGTLGAFNIQAKDLANPDSYILPKNHKTTNSDASNMAKYKSDYQQLSTSFKALTQALKRESANANVDNSDTISKAEANAARAADHARSKQYDKAYDTLQTSFNSLKTELVKLENRKGQGNNNIAMDTSEPPPSADAARTQLEQDFKTSAALLDALKRQNKEKSGGKDGDISNIEQTASDARNALNNGNLERAQQLIQDANSRTKATIASLQPTPNVATDTTGKSGDNSDALENYSKRKESTIALINAGKRVDDERKTQHATFEKAEGMIADADKLASSGQLEEAKNTLDKAYTMVQNEMRGMMGRKKGEGDKHRTEKKPKSQHAQH